MNPADLLSALKRTVEQLSAQNEIAKALTSTLDVRELLELVMQKVSELIRPDNWSLILQDENTHDLYFEIAVGPGAERLKDLRFKPGEGVAGTAFVTGESKRIDDVRAEPRFSRRFDEKSSFETRSILAVPLRCRGKSLGVIELVTSEGRPSFSEEDVQVASAIADYAAIALENARNFRHVQELTQIDEHTGLFNARHLRAMLSREVVRANRFNHSLSLLFLDLDHFKQVNDTHGHLVGSGLLREVGEVMRAGIRQVDSPFRYGGDEFAVMLVETDQKGAVEVGNRILEAFRARRFLKSQGLKIELTASIGSATFPQDAQTVDGLIQKADEAMYKVKAKGRNSVMPSTPKVPAGKKPTVRRTQPTLKVKSRSASKKSRPR